MDDDPRFQWRCVGFVAIGTEDGCVFHSADAGRRWESVAKGLAPVRAVAFG